MKKLDFDAIRKSSDLGELMEWGKWIHEIPFIPFKSGWLVSPIPPFCGAVARFRVKTKGLKNSVSVYLDCYDQLGYFGQPYWEIYPVDGDTARIPMNDVKGLVREIGLGLRQIKKEEL